MYSLFSRLCSPCFFFFFFFNDTATTEIYTLSLHDALPISTGRGRYGTGWAGSEVNSSLPSGLVGGSNDSTPSARKYSRRCATSTGGHLSKLRQLLVPASNSHALGNRPSPSPLSQYANQRDWRSEER